MSILSVDFIKGINSKNPQVWKRFYKDYFNSLCNYAYRIIKDEDIVSDIVQDTLIKVWEGNSRFENIKALTVYVYRAVNNAALNYLRDKNSEDSRIKQWAFFNNEMSKDAFSGVVTEEVIRKLRSVIDTLPESRKEVVVMSMSGMKGKEIAEELGITEATVKQHKYRAYKYIKSIIGDEIITLMIMFYKKS